MSAETPLGRKKLSVVFVAFTDLRTGAGTETVLLNYVQHSRPAEMDICVVETDSIFHGVSFKREEEVERSLGNSKRLRIHDFSNSFAFVSRFWPAAYFFDYFMRPLLYRILGRIVYRELFDELSTYDFAVLMDNNYALCFPKPGKRSRISIVATSQCFNPGPFALLLIKANPLSWLHRVQSIQLFRERPEVGGLLSDKNVFTLPNGVNSSLFSPLDHPGGKVRILFAARLTEAKGTRVVIDSWMNMERRGMTELHIAGGGPLQDFVEHVTCEDLYFHGPLPEGELADLCGKSDIFLYPTKGDTFALVALQALSAGVYTMVSSELRGIYDDFVERGWAEYIPPRDTVAISGRLDTVVENWKRDTSSRQQCHLFTAERFDWEIVANTLYGALSEMYSAHTQEQGA